MELATWFLLLLRELAMRILSLRWNIVTEAISLPVDRHTAFAMTIYTTLVMTKAKMAARLKTSRHELLFSGFAKNFFYGGDPARSCEGRTAPSKPPLPWPTLFQLNFIRTLIFKNIVCEGFFCFVSCKRVLSLAMEWNDRSNLIANRSPHCVRDDNLYCVRDDNLFEYLSATCLANRTCRKFLVIAKERKDFFAKPKCEPATSHTCGVVEAICFQVRLVFGLLRYARNDKKNKMATRLKASRHDKLSYVCDKLQVMKSF